MKKYLLVCLALCGLSAAQSSPVCTDPSIRWKQVEQKANDSSLNGNYYIPASAEDLNRVVKGVESYVIALDVDATDAINSLCSAVDRQQAEIDQLRVEVEALKKQLRQANATRK